jgi:hypothetical protein
MCEDENLIEVVELLEKTKGPEPSPDEPPLNEKDVPLWDRCMGWTANQ